MNSDIDQMLQEVEQRFREAKRRAEAAEAELDQARLERDAFRRIVGRHRGAPVPEPEVTSDWTTLTRGDAIIAVLREAQTAQAPRAIADLLIERGRAHESAALVSNVLDALKKRGDVISPTRGFWTVPKRLQAVQQRLEEAN